MKLWYLLFCVFPLTSLAQINRSANELAHEKVGTYITTRLFKNQGYTPGSYSELHPQQQPQQEIAWYIHHRFEIIDSQFVNDRRVAVRTPYYFSFYLDKKLNVLSAESYTRH